MSILNPHPKPSRTTFRGLPAPIWPPGPEMPLNTGGGCVENRGSHLHVVGSQNGRRSGAVGAHPRRAASKSENLGCGMVFRGMRVFG